MCVVQRGDAVVSAVALVGSELLAGVCSPCTPGFPPTVQKKHYRLIGDSTSAPLGVTESVFL